MKKVINTIIVLTSLQLLAVPALASEPWRYENADRIVAFSDIHGAYEAMVTTLQNAGVIDAELNWSGGGTHFVLVGDIMDRGPDSRAAMDLLMKLESQAVAAGGMVHVLIGNHEVMMVIGDVRYVHPGEYAAFADDETAEQRERWFQAYRQKRELPGTDIEESRAQFDRTFPAGFFAHRAAFSPAGKYGSWILSKPMIVVVNRTAFVHGGLSPSVAETGLAGSNESLRGDIESYSRAVQLLIDEGILLPTDPNSNHVDIVERVNPRQTSGTAVIEAMADIERLFESLYSYQNPLWYRGHTYCSELIEGDRVDAALEEIGADRVVVGHTPTPTREFVSRLDGRVIEVDTGMNHSYYKGRGRALVIEDGEMSVVTEEGSAGVLPHTSLRKVGARPGLPMSTAKIEELLRTGEIVSASDDDPDRLQVTDGEQYLDVRFTRAKRGNFPDVAAYRLDKLIGLDMVPVAVVREYGGKEGSLQFMPVKSIDERQRQAEMSGGGAWCPLRVQWETMMIFDALIANDARSADTIFYNRTNWQLMLIGHSSAFTLSTAQSTRFEETRIRIGPTWSKALKSLETDVLSEALGDVLDKRRVRALSKRSDLLLKN